MKIHHILTASRVVLAPVVVALILRDQRLAAAAMYGAAAATDFFDGYFARRSGSASERGDVFDAVADCVLVYLVATVLALQLQNPWLLALIAMTAVLLIAIIVRISVRKKTLSLPHLRSARVLAFFVHAIVLAYIVEWSRASSLVVIGLVPGMYAVWEYTSHAADRSVDRDHRCTARQS